MNKRMTAREAVQLVKNGDTVAFSGFVGNGNPEELSWAMGKRYEETGTPENLTLLFAAGQGDGGNRGINHLAHEGLIQRVVGGHYNNTPKIGAMAMAGKIEAYNFPQGVISHLYRAIAAKRLGVFTEIGLNTFVDPRLEGGHIGPKKGEDLVQLLRINGKDLLFYKAFPVQVAFIRGTTADEDGNITMEKESANADCLEIAQAARNSGGKVLVQVERIAARGTLDPRMVKIPGILVDGIIESSNPSFHMQTFGEQYNPGLSGEIKIPHIASKTGKHPLDVKQVIARRAALELRPGAIVNLGIGSPERISVAAREDGILEQLTMTVESGLIGGAPAGGLSFGASLNPDAILSQANQFDFYDGGGLDMAFLGMAEADCSGNVNVSKYNGHLSGCGGFINISQNVPKVVFCGAFTGKGVKCQIARGQVRVEKEGAVRKFVRDVEQVTFSGKNATEKKQEVLYITERAVFRLLAGRMTLIEIAPGIDLERDVLAQMGFRPEISQPLGMMPRQCFIEEDPDENNQ